MKISFNSVDKKISSVVLSVAHDADRQGLRAFIVGGFVRDLILKRKNLDFDFVIEGDGILFAKLLAKKFKAAVTVYNQFQTATVALPQGLKFDVATSRKEVYPHPGALPVVAPAALYEDLFRRDFTINAMAVAINRNRLGELIDEFGGFEDLKKKNIRVLHTKSFIDDPTRILRAVRFEQRFGFIIEKETLALLKNAVSKNAVAQVKSPRYFEEFRKILQENEVKKNVRRLFDLGGMKFIDENWIFDQNLGSLLDAVKGNIAFFQKKLLRHFALNGWIAYFMALLRGLPFEKVESLLEKFQFNANDRDQVLLSAFCQKTLKRLSVGKLAPHDIFHILKPFGPEGLVYLYSCSQKGILKKRIQDFLTKYESVSLTVSGSDLKRLGFKPGPRMGSILEEILNQKIDGKIKDRSGERKLAKSLCSR